MSATIWTGQEIYAMTTDLLGEQPMPQSLFLTLIQLEQGRVEMTREWMALRKTDTSQILLPSDTYLTAKTMPTDFAFWQSEDAIILVNPQNTNNFQDDYFEIPYAQLIIYQQNTYRYACDYGNLKMYFTGNPNTQYTIYQNYVFKPDAVTLTTSWELIANFPKLNPLFSSYLAYAIVARYKGGVDYDDNNRAQAGENATVMNAIYDVMEAWDTRLQVGSLAGIERGPINDSPTFFGGRVPIYP